MGNSLQISNEDASKLYFAITSMDGYGIESQPTQQISPDEAPRYMLVGAAKTLVCDGEKVYLGETTKNLDTDMFVVESMQGVTLLHTKATDNALSISRLVDGVYRVQSLNKKGIRHTLGTFIKKKMKKN